MATPARICRTVAAVRAVATLKWMFSSARRLSTDRVKSLTVASGCNKVPSRSDKYKCIVSSSASRRFSLLVLYQILPCVDRSGRKQSRYLVFHAGKRQILSEAEILDRLIRGRHRLSEHRFDLFAA